MKPNTHSKPFQTSKEVALRWNYHPSHIVRVMRRYGISGTKFGNARQAARRFSEEEVTRVERLAGLTAGGTTTIVPT